MRFMDEATSAALITHELAYDAVRRALIEAATGAGTVFPAVAAHGADPANAFTVKTGSAPGYAGVKIGSYWPGNDELGLPRHGTTVVLVDQRTGVVAAAVEAARVNAYRTAAADAVAADVLARPDATVLAVFGSGHQAEFECRALARIRPLERVHVVGRDPDRVRTFCDALAAHGIDAAPTAAEAACRAADIVVTATTARSPLFDAEWITPGTHVASMGSDAVGKQELPVELLTRTALFCDLPAQSVRIGELQHVAERVTAGDLPVTAIGAVLAGTAPGRRSAADVTVFDSSGLALQDLAVATALLDAADSAVT
jgi:ornithine cyclodeaminase